MVRMPLDMANYKITNDGIVHCKHVSLHPTTYHTVHTLHSNTYVQSIETQSDMMVLSRGDVAEVMVHCANAKLITFGQLCSNSTSGSNRNRCSAGKLSQMHFNATDNRQRSTKSKYTFMRFIAIARIHLVRCDSIFQIEINWNSIRFAFGNFTNHNYYFYLLLLSVPTHTWSTTEINKVFTFARHLSLFIFFRSMLWWVMTVNM